MKQIVAVLVGCMLVSLPAVVRAGDAKATPDASVLSRDTPPRRVAVHSTTAFGLRGGRFVNELVGARFDLLTAARFAVELDIAYANLDGKDGRVHNVLPQVALRYRLALGATRFGIPLRFAGGYLPKNGPTARVAAGVDFDATDSVRIELTPLEPMLWVVRERSELSLNLGANVAVAF
jgi:hypothetical protein